MKPLKLTNIGNSEGVTLPKSFRDDYNLTKGDLLYPIKSPLGLILSPFDPEFAEQMDLARAIMKEDRDVLRELSK